MTRDTRNRRSASVDFGELSARKRRETLEGFGALVGGAVRAAREGGYARAVRTPRPPHSSHGRRSNGAFVQASQTARIHSEKSRASIYVL